jgi:oxygen-dependent protoporphyrinogen oxidase
VTSDAAADAATEQRHEAVIIGGGIAGLSAGWRLRHRDVVLLEAEQRVGGRIKSEPRGRYWLNFGAHVFGGPDSRTGRLLDETGVRAAEVPGLLTGLALNGRILSSGRVETYPFRLPLAAGDRLALIRAGLRLRLAVMRYDRVARSRPGEPDARRRMRTLAFLGNHSFSEFLGPLPPDIDAIFRPTIERSSGEPEDVAAGYGVGYFHLVWNRTQGLSRNILGGSSTLTGALARALDGRIATASRVEEVAEEADAVRIRYTQDGASRELRAQYAVVATPADVTRSIVRDLPSEVQESLERIVYGPYVVAAFLTGESAAMPWDGLYALATAKRSFNMLFNTANVLRVPGQPREPGGSLMVYSGAGLARRLFDADDESVVNTYLEDLYDLYPQLRGLIREAVVQRWERGLPYPRPGRYRLQAALERPLGRLYLAGDYLGTWYTETAIETGTAAAAAIDARLGPTG